MERKEEKRSTGPGATGKRQKNVPTIQRGKTKEEGGQGDTGHRMRDGKGCAEEKAKNGAVIATAGGEKAPGAKATQIQEERGKRGGGTGLRYEKKSREKEMEQNRKASDVWREGQLRLVKEGREAVDQRTRMRRM